jgi:hypothetical protein
MFDLFIYKDNHDMFVPFLWLCFSGTIRDVDDYFNRYDDLIIVLTQRCKYTQGAWINPEKYQLSGFGG